MVGVNRFTEGYGVDAAQNILMRFGELIHEVDTADAYEVDEAKLYRKDDKYALLQASGCSCWDGDYDGWEDMTLDELLGVAKSWAEAKDYETTEREMGAWILAELPPHQLSKEKKA